MNDQPVQAGKQGRTFERVRASIMHRFNPVRYATAERLGSELDLLYTGVLSIARFWECIQNRDEMVRTADGKRKDSVELMEWTINTDSSVEGNEALAERQKEALNAFYTGIQCTDIMRQDLAGGVGILARQMLDARAKGWSAHEIIWRPAESNGFLTATFRHCPLYWFENRTGKLRFIESDGMSNGVEMLPNEWLVTVADNYMEAITGPWLYKLDLMRAWVRFCERFGNPLPIGKTNSPAGSQEWNDLVEALQAINEDWALALNAEASVEFAQLDRSGDGTYATLIEEIKRSIVTVILGADLSTISAQSGQGQGASLQGREDEKREKADACLVTEALNRHIDRFVIEYNFGPNVPVLAKFTLVPPKRIDVNSELAVDNFFVTNGIELGKDDLRERYGRSEPNDGDEAIEKPDPEPTEPDPMANDGQLVKSAEREAANARAEDLMGIARELGIIMAIDDPATVRNSLKNWVLNNKERAERMLSTPGRLGPALEKLLASATLNGITSAKRS